MANQSITDNSNETISAKKNSQSNFKDESGRSFGLGKSNQHISLKNFLVDGLKDIYSAEQQLLKALPEMAKAAYTEDLQEAFLDHLQETKHQVERLEGIFLRLKLEPQAEKCEAMAGLIKEANKIIEQYDEGCVRDAALIIAAQKVEHYEIATYGSLAELADVLGYHKIADILEDTLDEEGDANELLTDIAMDVNDDALDESEGKGYYASESYSENSW